MEQVIANGLYLGAQYALIALGLTLIFGLMNVLNFAHGQMYVLGGFITYAVYGQLGLPFPLAVFASGVTLFVIGGLMERYLFRTVIKRSHREESTMLLAAATAFFFDAVILLIFGEKQRGVPKIVKGVFNDFGVILPYDRILVGILAGLCIIAFILALKYTKPGRAMRALAQDRVAAQLHSCGCYRGTSGIYHRDQCRHRRAHFYQGIHDDHDWWRWRRWRCHCWRIYSWHDGISRPHGSSRIWRRDLSGDFCHFDDFPQHQTQWPDGQALGLIAPC